MVAAFLELRMRHRSALIEDSALRLGAVLTGVTFLVSAWLAVDLARGHMATLGTICGASNAPHCGWCFGAAVLVLAGLAAFVYAMAKPSPGFRRSGLLQVKTGSAALRTHPLESFETDAVDRTRGLKTKVTRTPGSCQLAWATASGHGVRLDPAQGGHPSDALASSPALRRSAWTGSRERSL